MTRGTYNYEFNEVNIDDNTDLADNTTSWKYFFRQAFLFSSMWPMFFVAGMAMGAPTVFIPQIRREYNSTEVIDESMFSWLTSMFSFAAMPWVIIMPILASYFGRKLPFILATIAMLVGSVVFYCSKNVIQILISEAFNAIVNATLNTIGSSMVIPEYISPKYRGTFLTFKSATLFWGVWVSNAIGTYFHWKYIPLVMIILSVYPIVIVWFWPESPYYLANKSKFDECIKSHVWLKGSNKVAKKELCRLLSLSDSVSKESTFREIISSKRFYKATLLGICLFALYTFTGKMVCTMYSIDIIKKMTSSERTAYTGMLTLDGVTVFSMYVGSVLTRMMKRRVLLFSSTTVGIVSLIFLSFYVYLVNSLYISESKFASVALLSIYSIAIGIGPMIMTRSLYSELAPLQFKSLAVSIIVTVDKLIMGTVVKLTPLIIRTVGLHGTFLFFGISSAVCLMLLFLYMPETKDKTLFEISDAINGNIKIDTNNQI